MSEFVWYRPLDGIGALAVDLHGCRRFVLRTFDPFNGVDYGLTYYLHVDVKSSIRWIACRGQEEYCEDPPGPRMEYYESYYEQEPQAVAHNFIMYGTYGDRLPVELEEFRHFAQQERFTLYVMETNELEDPDVRSFAKAKGELLDHRRSGRDGNSRKAAHRVREKPIWDRENLVLSVGDVVCRRFRRAKGNDQLKILDTFHAENWPDSVKDPFADELKLRETVKSFNRVASTAQRSEKVFRLLPARTRIGWFFGPPSELPSYVPPISR